MSLATWRVVISSSSTGEPRALRDGSLHLASELVAPRGRHLVAGGTMRRRCQLAGTGTIPIVWRLDERPGRAGLR